MSTAPLDVERVLREHVRPALSSHAGGIRVSSLTDDEVRLDFQGSCSACYFRRSCAEGVVRPALEEYLAEGPAVLIDGRRG